MLVFEIISRCYIYDSKHKPEGRKKWGWATYYQNAETSAFYEIFKQKSIVQKHQV